VNGPAVGAAYLFTRTQATETSTIWQEQQKILSIDGAGGDAFGFSLAVNGEIAIIGSPLDDIVVEDTDETDSTDTATTFTNNGSAHILVMTSRPPICPVKTDYEDAKCSDTFFVASLTDLDAYVANDFGRADNDGKYKHLNVTANLSAAFLLLQSPCEIILDAGVSLSGEFVIIDGRQGVSGGRPRIEAKKVCVLSEQGNVSPGDDAVIEVGELTLQAGGGAIIGDDATVTVDGALTIETVGDAESSAAVIDSGAVVSAGSLLITSPRAVQIREEARISVDGVLSLISTQDNSESEAVVEENIQIQATDLTISSPRKAEIGKGTSITLFGNGELVSGSEAVVNKNVTIYVVGNFRMEAADAGQCEISGSAQISAGTKSGNCF